ncbi:hypothetical protein [Brevundimonas sp. A19_0]|uniref:hypothetical protein n=1 Tax=Brevundimonas sp. A19_0 TaxID=2821087 RepID=UPI001ADA3D46|nr:hypothetical protein [Brevundimonas sp. A19_0]MBO9501629.1 hypothetical protein [Brevundimonas sp. A19_0]
MIDAPKENLDRALWRAVAEAVTQFTPVTAALSRLYQTTHPSQFQKDVETWRDAVTDASNDHEARLQALEALHNPKFRMSVEASALAVWLVETSEFGLEDPVTFDAIRVAFPDVSVRDLEDAAAELSAFGLASTTAASGHPVRSVRPLYPLFALFDPVVKGVSPQDDAATLAAKALELDSGNVPNLMAALDWDARRLNPALQLLMSVIPGPISQTISPDLATRFFGMTPETRVTLKRLRPHP